MFNKIYEKIVKFIKEEYKFILVCFIVLMVGTIRLPVNLYVGGGTINLDKRIIIENENKDNGSFNLAYVKESRATLPTYLLSFILPWDRENIEDIKLDENDNTKNIWKRERLYLQEANDNAIINAYKLAGEFIDIKREVYKILYIDNDADTNLEIDDAIISIDGISIQKYDDIKTITDSKNYDDKITILVERDKKEIECYARINKINDEKKLGIYLIKLFDYKLERDIKLDFSSREGGSSGGFMLSLAIYSRLIEEDITKGLTIVGTGTIDSEGNVGEIGGVKYKLMGAVREKADIFFVPDENYQETVKLKDENNYKIEIISVHQLIDAINYLESR